MRRNALKAFFERVIISSLPLVVAAGCKTTTPGNGNPSVTDLAPGVGGGGGAGGTGGAGGSGGGSHDMAFNGMPTDMLPHGPPDLYGNKDADVCDWTQKTHMGETVVFPASQIPDGGYFRQNGGRVLGLTCPGDLGTCVCVQFCPAPYNTCNSHDQPVDMAGGATGPGGYLVACGLTCGASGRRPQGLEAAVPSAGCATGHYFATMAHLEAASVHAFRIMARELVAHGAPAELVADAKRAIADEIRHARLTRRFALAHGSRPAPVKVTPARARSLEEMALENAAEGCVRETFAALLASWQARAAADPAVRELMSGIATDETRHAELAWNLDSWLKTKLDRAARARVKEARRRSADELATEMRQPVAPKLVQTLGLPDADRARELVAAVERELWS